MNYNQEMKKIINVLFSKKRLLLHSCCAPCSSHVITTLLPYFDITILYYNPNIEPESEYIKRKNEQIRFIKELNSDIKVIDSIYDNSTFRNVIKGFENESEGGARCERCIKHRLEYTMNVALNYNFDYFGTTLTVSPHKNSEYINKCGIELSIDKGIDFLLSDFKKEAGYKKSIVLSKEYNLYRQDYCGCIFSKKTNIDEEKNL